MKIELPPGSEPTAALRRLFIECVQTVLDNLTADKSKIDIHASSSSTGHHRLKRPMRHRSGQ